MDKTSLNKQLNKLTKEQLIDVINGLNNMCYILESWPETQTYMDEPWFQEEAIFVNTEKYNNSDYMIPLKRSEILKLITQ